MEKRRREPRRPDTQTRRLRLAMLGQSLAHLCQRRAALRSTPALIQINGWQATLDEHRDAVADSSFLPPSQPPASATLRARRYVDAGGLLLVSGKPAAKKIAAGLTYASASTNGTSRDGRGSSPSPNASIDQPDRGGPDASRPSLPIPCDKPRGIGRDRSRPARRGC